MRHIAPLAFLTFAAVAGQACAASFLPTDDVTYSGSAVVVTNLNASNGNIVPPVSYGVSNAFNGMPIAADFPSNLTPGSGGPWNFYDDYIFTIAAGGANIQSALIAFSSQWSGITALQGRIIGVNGTFNAANNLGAPASGNTLVDSWLTDSPSQGINIINLNTTTFGPGTYDLQVRGEAVGSPPTGGYGGSITFTPVPLPATLPLMLSGFGLLFGLRARRGAPPLTA